MPTRLGMPLAGRSTRRFERADPTRPSEECRPSPTLVDVITPRKEPAHERLEEPPRPADPPPEHDGAPVLRRTIVAGAAWTIPVVAGAAAAPLAAASDPQPVQTVDLDITYAQMGSIGGTVAYAGPTGEPGWGQNSGLTLHLQVTNNGPGTATQFTIDTYFDPSSYANGSASNNRVPGGFTIASVFPSGGFAVVRMVWNGSLAPGQSVDTYLDWSTPGWIGGERRITTLASYLIQAEPGDTNGGNNAQQSTPYYWLKQL